MDDGLGIYGIYTPGLLFTKRTYVLPQDLVKSRSSDRDSGLDFSNRSKFDRNIDSSAVDMPVKLQSDAIIITANLAASRFHEIWRWDRCYTAKGPFTQGCDLRATLVRP